MVGAVEVAYASALHDALLHDAQGGGRANTVSPGAILTPLAYDEFAAAGDNYQQMIGASAAERCGTSDEIAEAGAFLLGDHAGFIAGTDLLIDGGAIAAIRTEQYRLH